jgi:hypothetical protein
MRQLGKLYTEMLFCAIILCADVTSAITPFL